MEAFLERVHRLPVKPETRQEPMQVLALGIQRSGTESLARALDILGYKTYHGWNVFLRPTDAMLWAQLGKAKYSGPASTLHSSSPSASSSPAAPTARSISNPTSTPLRGLTSTDFDALLAPYTAVTDFPACAFARDLHLAYPSAKLILNTRPPEAWHSSWLSTIYKIRLSNDTLFQRVLCHFGAVKYWNSRVAALNGLFWRGARTRDLPHTSRWVYEEHSAMVRGLVASMTEKERKERFLEWTISDGWGPLCAFLGKEVPEEEFPSGNASAEAMGRLAPILKRAEMEASWNLGIVVGVVVVAGLAWVWIVFMG